MSKGSTPRPLSVPQETFADRWSKTFASPRGKLWNPGLLPTHVLGSPAADPETKEEAP